MSQKPVIVTGSAGFIGFHVARYLLEQNYSVIGVDSFVPYYDLSLKETRWTVLNQYEAFTGFREDLAESSHVERLFKTYRPDIVIHLAAQPGVRYSLETPSSYLHANINAFLNILEGCRSYPVQHLIYASSSSVYGLNTTLPFSETDPIQKPSNLYAATKIAGEAMAFSYSHLFSIPATGLRFFTVYGPWGRPDMAVFAFTDAIAHNRPIYVAKAGKIWRDFTYIDDIVSGIKGLMGHAPEKNGDCLAVHDSSSNGVLHQVFNIGNDHPEELNDLISYIEEVLGTKSVRIEKELPPGDLIETRANIDALRKKIGFMPKTGLKDGVYKFVRWYKDYYF